MGIVSRIAQSLQASIADSSGTSVSDEQRLKHLEFLQGAIARMSRASFLFKGWTITIATALAAFGAVETERTLLAIALVTTTLFWGMDAYYLWLERGFVEIHKTVARLPVGSPTDFNMAIDKKCSFWRWLKTCLRWHLFLFYGAIVLVDVIAIVFFKEVSHGTTYVFQF